MSKTDADRDARRQATAAVLEAERQRRLQERARDDLMAFVRATSGPEYDAGWVHRDICRRLERFSAQVAAKQSPRLIIAMPPRHGKTHIVSQRWPVWHLGRNPGHELVCASYGAELAEDNSRAAREVARSEEALAVFPDLLPEVKEKRHYADYRRSDVDRVNQWKVGTRGSYKAVGVGGALTGRGAHALIVDDPFKDRAEADSEARRKLVWGWYTSTAYTRLAPGGGIIVMATRWHEDDLTGRLLRKMREDDAGDQWEIVSYPAIAEHDELHRRAGEALHPARYPLPMLEGIKAAIGSREWVALYQQRPSPAGGGLFKREWMGQRYTFDPQRAPFDEIVIDVDATFKGGKNSDFVVMQAWGRRGWASFYLLDQIRDRMSYVETRAALRGFVRKWHRAREVRIEAKANGQALIDELGSEIPGVLAFNPTEKKETRAEVAAVAFEAGNVWLPDERFAPWIGDYIEELCAFPAGANDDQVDATSQRMIVWMERARKPDINAHLRFAAGW